MCQRLKLAGLFGSTEVDFTGFLPPEKNAKMPPLTFTADLVPNQNRQLCLQLRVITEFWGTEKGLGLGINAEWWTHG